MFGQLSCDGKVLTKRVEPEATDQCDENGYDIYVFDFFEVESSSLSVSDELTLEVYAVSKKGPCISTMKLSLHKPVPAGCVISVRWGVEFTEVKLKEKE